MNIPMAAETWAAAYAPTQAKRGDAGYDLRAPYDDILEPGERKVIDTGLSFAIPEGYYGRIAPRSGLAAKMGIDVLGGVVDSSYRGKVGVILLNTGSSALAISKGDRIAQLIIEACHTATFVPVDYLDASDRGAGGFGSTGH